MPTDVEAEFTVLWTKTWVRRPWSVSMIYRIFTIVVSLLVKALTVTGGSITGAREVPELAGDRLASSTSSSRTA